MGHASCIAVLPGLQVAVQPGHVLAMLMDEVAKQGQVFLLIAVEGRQPLVEIQARVCLQAGKGPVTG